MQRLRKLFTSTSFATKVVVGVVAVGVVLVVVPLVLLLLLVVPPELAELVGHDGFARVLEAEFIPAYEEQVKPLGSDPSMC